MEKFWTVSGVTGLHRSLEDAKAHVKRIYAGATFGEEEINWVDDGIGNSVWKPPFALTGLVHIGQAHVIEAEAAAASQTVAE